MRTSDGWTLRPPHTSADGPRWVIVDAVADLPSAARRHGHRRPVRWGSWSTADRGRTPPRPDHPVRAHLDRSPDGELVLTAPTLSYVEATHDVHTGSLTCVVGTDVVIMAEDGEADVIGRAVEKLTGGYPVPDEGVHQVLAAVLLALVAEASDVEVGLGDAVADVERVVFSTGRVDDPVEQIYDLKREIAEARRALAPVTSVLSELLAAAEDDVDDPQPQPWLVRLQSWVDRLDQHLDGYDDLLGDMLSVHLSQVSVRQNEDVRKISALGRDRGGADPRRQHLRHELPAHAGARLDGRVPARHRRDGRALRDAVRAVPPVRLAVRATS